MATCMFLVNPFMSWADERVMLVCRLLDMQPDADGDKLSSMFTDGCAAVTLSRMIGEAVKQPGMVDPPLAYVPTCDAHSL